MTFDNHLPGAEKLHEHALALIETLVGRYDAAIGTSRPRLSLSPDRILVATSSAFCCR